MTRPRLALVLLVLLIAGGLTWGYLPRPVAVEIAEVTRGPLAVTVEEEGRTRVRDRYVIHAPMSGHARRIDLKVGDIVRPGQVLTVLEPIRADALDPRTRSQAQAQARAAEAALAAAREEARAAEAEAELARQELARAEALGEARFLSQAPWIRPAPVSDGQRRHVRPRAMRWTWPSTDWRRPAPPSPRLRPCRPAAQPSCCRCAHPSPDGC
jgi:multidrug efflux pump subunit AcrA (membrane-fusion protein)